MGIFQRAGDILAANINDLVDRFEDPEKMLRQAIREMEDCIGDAMDSAAKAIATEKLIAKDLDHHHDAALSWGEKAEQAVKAGDDPLARSSLRRKIEHDKFGEVLGGDLKAAETASAALRLQIDAMRAKLSEAKRKLAVLGARRRTADVRKQLHAGAACSGGGAFQKFERMRERIEAAEAEADALIELHDGAAGGGQPLEGSRQAEMAVDEELARLKEKVRGG